MTEPTFRETLRKHVGCNITSRLVVGLLVYRAFRGRKSKFCVCQFWRQGWQHIKEMRAQTVENKLSAAACSPGSMLGRNLNKKHMQIISFITWSQRWSTYCLSLKSIIKCRLKSGSVCRNVMGNFCPTLKDQKKKQFNFFFPHVFSTWKQPFIEIFLDLGPLNALFMIVCSISHQNNPQIIHLNVFCMLVSSPPL